MKTPDGGLAAVAYAPCLIETTIQGKPVQVAVTTTYPFRDEIAITVKVSEPLTFPLLLRVPGWAETCEIRLEDLPINLGGMDVSSDRIEIDVPKSDPNKSGMYLPVKARWNETKTLAIRFPMPVRLYRGERNAVAIERGPLVFALPIEAEWKKVKDNPQFADWEVYPKSPWNYALQIDREHPARSIAFEDRPIGKTPFSPQGAPVIAKVKGRRLPGWGLEKGAAAPPPPSPVISDEPLETLTLIPYGCTDLRITEVPVGP
jgi:hypothetical protein